MVYLTAIGTTDSTTRSALVPHGDDRHRDRPARHTQGDGERGFSSRGEARLSGDGDPCQARDARSWEMPTAEPTRAVAMLLSQSQ